MKRFVENLRRYSSSESRNLQTFVWWGTIICPPPPTPPRWSIFFRQRRIYSPPPPTRPPPPPHPPTRSLVPGYRKLGRLTNLKGLFPVVSTDFQSLVHVKSRKNCGKVCYARYRHLSGFGKYRAADPYQPATSSCQLEIFQVQRLNRKLYGKLLMRRKEK